MNVAVAIITSNLAASGTIVAVEIRLLTRQDVASAPDWLGDADLRPDRWRDESTRAVVGFDKGHLVAVGRIFTSRIHTDRYWTEVVVDPRSRRRGHGTAIAQYLAGLRPEPKPMCTRGFVSSESVLFARGLGARPYQTCPPEHVVTSHAAILGDPGRHTVRGSDAGLEELRRAWTDMYAWVHASWSPVVPGFEAPLLAGFNEEVDLAHTRVVVDPTIRAAAFVFYDHPDPIVVAECRSRDEPGGLDLLRACVRDSLHSLDADGIPAATFDGHDTDPHFRPLLDELPTTGERFELLEWT